MSTTSRTYRSRLQIAAGDILKLLEHNMPLKEAAAE